MLLEVIALDVEDAIAAAEGGADRLEVVSDMASDGLSPSPRVVEAIKAACDVPVRVMVRLRADFVVGRVRDVERVACELRSAGADGFVMGFLTDAGELDTATLVSLATVLDLPWTCHRAVDGAVDYGAAVSTAAGLKNVDQILTAGSAAGVAHGLDVVRSHAAVGPLMAGGGLKPEHVGVLKVAGVSAFHVGSAVRDSWETPIDGGRVAWWRNLVDES